MGGARVTAVAAAARVEKDAEERGEGGEVGGAAHDTREVQKLGHR